LLYPESKGAFSERESERKRERERETVEMALEWM
jgi:hypothetical protein